MLPNITSPLLIDANLLLIVIVGLVDRGSVGKVMHTKEYDESALTLLEQFIDSSPSLTVTPYVFVETSNLLGKALTDAYLQAARGVLAMLAREHAERTIALKELAESSVLVINGVTDAALFEIARTQCCTLLTVDSKLYDYSARHGVTALNFNHYRFQ